MLKEKRVLLAEDNADTRFYLKEILELLECSYKVVSNGKEAIDHMGEKQYDLVFLDIEMPVMNGLETARFIRGDLNFDKSDLPVVAITGHNIEEQKTKLRNIGFNDFIVKPFTFDKIKCILDKYFQVT